MDRLDSESLAVRYVERFASDGKTATDSDWNGWLRIFQEFEKRDVQEYYERVRKRINNRH